METKTSEDSVVEVDDSTVDVLVELAKARGLDDLALDDLVHDCCDATASRWVNESDAVDEDGVYAECSLIGSEVNNGGMRAQVAFLLAELGEAGARSSIDAA